MKTIWLITNLDLSKNDGASRHFIDNYIAFKNYPLKVKVFTRKISNFEYPFPLGDAILIPTLDFKCFGVFGTLIMVSIFEFMLCTKLFLNIFKKKPDGIYLRESILNYGTFLFTYFTNIPFIIETNNLILEDLKEGNKGAFIWFVKLFEKINFRKAKLIFSVTENMKSYFINVFNLSADKIIVIPNGFHFNRLRKTSIDYNSSENRQSMIRLLYLGGLHKREGVQILLNAISKLITHHEIIIDVVGSGPYENELEKLSKKLNLERVVSFHGAVDGEKVDSFLNMADICLAPLIRERNEITGVSPIKVYEYLAYKKPLIASRIPGLEFIEENNVGLLFEPDNPDDLAEKIVWMSNHLDEGNKMAEKGFRYVSEHHDWEKLSRKVITLSLKNYE